MLSSALPIFGVGIRAATGAVPDRHPALAPRDIPS